MQRLQDQVVIIFGAATGIGAATAQRLAEEGASLCLADINLARAEALTEEITGQGRQAFATQVDIADEEAIKATVAATIARYGKLTGAHINAADMQTLRRDSNILEIDMADFDRTIAVNLRGHALCTRAVLPHLIQNPQSSIVYTSSGAWNAGEPVRPAYAITKAGLNALMRHVAAGWGKQGLTANCIAPGVTPTESATANTGLEFEQASLDFTPHTRLGLPEDHASAVAFLMSADGRWINGQVIGINGGAAFQ